MTPHEAFQWLQVVIAYTAYVVGTLTIAWFLYASYYEWKETTK